MNVAHFFAGVGVVDDGGGAVTASGDGCRSGLMVSGCGSVDAGKFWDGGVCGGDGAACVGAGGGGKLISDRGRAIAAGFVEGMETSEPEPDSGVGAGPVGGAVWAEWRRDRTLLRQEPKREAKASGYGPSPSLLLSTICASCR